jgi:hypothetical protein
MLPPGSRFHASLTSTFGQNDAFVARALFVSDKND